jgi:hypothetical protein
MSVWRRFLSITICRIVGHTKPAWQNFFIPWSGGWIKQSGQCKRCWMVIDEREVWAGVDRGDAQL